jgi:GAF domain-containing protein
MKQYEIESLDSLYRVVQDQLGVKLFTVLAFRDEGAVMERIYSSHPAEYPVGGRKVVAQDVAADWLAACLTEQVPFFGRTPEDVDRIFKDSELIRSLGCGSIINAPIVDGGTTVAALNILDAAGTYTDDDVATAVDIARRSKNAILEAMKEK